LLASHHRYLAVFAFLLLATPLVTGLSMSESAQAVRVEDRTIAPPPHVSLDWNALIALPKQTDDYLQDRFGLRREMIRWRSIVTQRIFVESNQKVLVGYNDRMFYLLDDAVRESAGIVRRDRQVIDTADFLVAVQATLARRGIRFLVSSPPDSSTIYQDDLPRWARNHGRKTEYDLFLQNLAVRGVKTVDLRPVMRAARADGKAYFKHDTHWTPRGALAAFDAIAKADGHPDWRIDASTALGSPTERKGGDLARMLGVNDEVAEPNQALTLSVPRGARIDLAQGPSPPYVATSDKPGETVMIIGDSFTAEYFAPMLLRHVGRVVWLHHKLCGFDWKLVDRFPLDEVWWMPTERILTCRPGTRPAGFPDVRWTVRAGVGAGG